MRARRDRAFHRILGVTMVWGATLLGAAYGAGLGAFGLGAAVGALVGLAGALALVRAMTGGNARRREALARPFPDRSRHLLLQRYDHFNRLPSDWRGRFEDDVRLFLADARITGVEMEVTDDLRLLVAASAVTLSLGWPDYEWKQLGEILLYPTSFDRDYRFGGDLAGMSHAEGTVILSVPALRESFRIPGQGYQVGLHEFTHLLTLHSTHMGEIPEGLAFRRRNEWVLVVEREMDRLRRGKSALDPYGSDAPVEFVAVAVEAFFGIPLEVRKRHAELYALLAEYFAQDPAAWDDARGLTLS